MTSRQLLPAALDSDHEQADWDETDRDDDECNCCQAILMDTGRCWYCDRAWIWEGR